MTDISIPDIMRYLNSPIWNNFRVLLVTLSLMFALPLASGKCEWTQSSYTIKSEKSSNKRK